MFNFRELLTLPILPPADTAVLATAAWFVNKGVVIDPPGFPNRWYDPRFLPLLIVPLTTLVKTRKIWIITDKNPD